MNKLILVGNGFDLAHGLPTKYADFIDDFWKNLYDRKDEPTIKEIVAINEGSNFFLAFQINSQISIPIAIGSKSPNSKNSKFQKFQIPKIPNSKNSKFQKFQNPKFPNFQIFKFSNFQIFQSFNLSIKICTQYST